MAQRLSMSKAKKADKRPDLSRNKLPTEKRVLSPEKQQLLNTCLFEEAKEGETKRVENLLNLGADVNARDKSYYNWTALMWAAIRKQTKTCRLLIGKGADVNASSITGQTALMVAAGNGLTETCKLLVEKGAIISTVDSGCNLGWIALTYAMVNGKKETIGFLTFAVIWPKIFADKKTSDLFYSTFKECASQ